ncbi:unnamed protein product [Closterium sp. NIES-65]|nr:unnamed protein product [Closterium sp. NIES-65]
MVRWISNAGPAGIPLTLQTIRDHVAVIARDLGKPPSFRCSVGWVRRALRRNGIRCQSAAGEAADQDMAAVRTCKEKLPQLLMHLCVSPRDIYNFDETALFLSVLPRKTYARSRLFTHFMEQLNTAMFAEERHIVILLDNASSHVLKTEGAETEDLFGFRTRSLSNLWLVFLPPNTTCFVQPLDQGLIAMMKARYRQHWLEAVVAKSVDGGATGNFARYKPNLRDVLAWLLDAWMNISTRTIQRCWWRTECLPLAWTLSLSHVGAAGLTPGGRGVVPLAIDLDGEIDDVGILIYRLGLGPSAMPAADFVAIDNGQPTCAEPGEDPLADEPASAYSAASWEAPTSMEAVYNDDNPASREARRYARAACEILIGYARAISITSRELCALFE